LAEHRDPWRLSPEPHYGRLPDGLLHLPLDGELDDLNFQSRHYNLPANRRAHHRRLRALPCEWQLQRHPSDRLLQLSHCGLAKHHDPRRIGAKSHHFRLSDHLRVVPHHDFMAGCGFQSQRNRFPADRRARHRGLQPLPHQFRCAADGLLQLPHCGLAKHGHAGRVRAGPYRVRFPGFKHVLDLPHDHGMDGRDIHALVVEDSPQWGHLRHLPSDSWLGHELRDVQLYQRMPHAGIKLAKELRAAQRGQLWPHDLHCLGMPPQWITKG
jgi:hypothetical protein